MDKKRFNELRRTGAKLEDHELLQGYHYCADWDYDLIAPNSPEEECCNCNVGHYYRALGDRLREGEGEETSTAQSPQNGEGNAVTLPAQGEASAALATPELDDVEKDASTDNWELDLSEPGPLAENFINFIDLLFIYDLRADSDADSIVTVTTVPEVVRDTAEKVRDILADYGWLEVEDARFVVKRYPVNWTPKGIQLGEFVLSTHYTSTDFVDKSNPLESQDKQKGPNAKETPPNSTHYRGDGIEPIDLIESQGFGIGFCAGNCIKYISRFDKKGAPVADVRKALWYGQRLLELLEKENEVDGTGS